jgi:hypothetical protein
MHSWTAAHFGKILKEFGESVRREPLIPAGAPVDYPDTGFKSLVRAPPSG